MSPPERFVADLRRLLELERRAGLARFERARQVDPAGRIAAGLAVGGLKVMDTSSLALGRSAWVLAPTQGELDSPAGVGDPVRVYRKRAPDEAVRGIVARRTRRQLTVVFDEPPPEELVASELVLEREWDETTHQRLLAGLSALESARKGPLLKWRELLSGATAPRFDAAVPVEDPRLNQPQREAVSKALAAQDISLVHGPPGTGKTEVLAAIAAAEVERGGTVLACAASHAAVDNLVARLAGRGLDPVRLGHPVRVHPLQTERTLEARAGAHEKARIAEGITREARDLLRRADRAARQGRAADRFAEARQARVQARRLFAEARTLAREAEDETLQKARVLCSTLTGLTGDRLGGRRFTLAVLDEATQSTVPATLLALLHADRAVLGGDHHQLPPTILSPEAARGGLARTLFERLHDAHADEIATMLQVQHRMHRAIMLFPSEELYGGRLVAHPSVESHLLADLPSVAREESTESPLLFVDSAGKGWSEETPAGSESKANPGEAARVVREVERLRSAGVRVEDIGVIAPYSGQVSLLRAMLPEEGLEIDTVDAFQGREKEAVIVSLTRSNENGELGFCADVRRMNVALTRARRRLVVIGDSATVGGHPFYADFLEYVQREGLYRSAWEEDA